MTTYQTHVAELSLMRVNPFTGEVYTSKNVPIKVAIKGASSFNLERRLIENPDIPNTTGNPDIISYAELEVADGFEVKYVGESLVVTQKRVETLVP